MGFMGNVLSPITGLFNPSQGTGFQAQGVPIERGATVQQATDLYNRTLGGIDQQQAFVNALAGQGGLRNQADVYKQMQGLAGQLGQQAAGFGPNPAQNALAQATGQNIAQQAALMGSQRGIGSNPALLARMAAQQGAATQQQAAGQSATMQAQQQLAAQQALQQQQGMLGNLANAQIGQQATGLQALNQAAQGAQQNVLNALGQQNQAAVSQQNAINAANAAIAQENARAQNQMGQSMLSGLGSAVAGPLSGLLASGASGLSLPALGSSFQSAANQSIGGFASNPLGGQGLRFADGGQVPNLKENYSSRTYKSKSSVGRMLEMAEGGEVPFKGYNPNKHSKEGGLNDKYREQYNREHGSHLKRPVTGTPKPGSEAAGRKKSFCARMKGVKGPTSDGGKLTPKGAALKRWNCHAHGGSVQDDHDSECVHYAAGGRVHDMKRGGHVPGKPKVHGARDSYSNDTVPAMLSPGEIVLPRSVTKSNKPVENAAKFVSAIMAKQGLRGKK